MENELRFSTTSLNRVFNIKTTTFGGHRPTELPFLKKMTKNYHIFSNFVPKNYHFQIMASLDDLNVFITCGTHPSGMTCGNVNSIYFDH